MKCSVCVLDRYGLIQSESCKVSWVFLWILSHKNEIRVLLERERERGDEDEEVRSVLFKLNDFDDFGFKFMNLELSL
jgi:hypothetical protein